VDHPRFDVVTFDCYGTLIDWEAGMSEAFAQASAADGVQLDPREVLRVLFTRGQRPRRPSTRPTVIASPTRSEPELHHEELQRFVVVANNERDQC